MFFKMTCSYYTALFFKSHFKTKFLRSKFKNKGENGRLKFGKLETAGSQILILSIRIPAIVGIPVKQSLFALDF